VIPPNIKFDIPNPKGNHTQVESPDSSMRRIVYIISGILYCANSASTVHGEKLKGTNRTDALASGPRSSREH